MKFRLVAAAAAAIGLMAASSSANALITVALPLELNDLFGTTLAAHGQMMLDDFDAINNVNTTYNGFVRGTQNPVTNSAAPPYIPPVPGPGSGAAIICCNSSGQPYSADATNYASVQANSTPNRYAAINGYYFTSFSFYMGSPDTYNEVTFNLRGGGSQTFVGPQIWGGNPPGNGDRSMGYRVYYNFNGAEVSSIDFRSVGADAFEFDGLAGTLAVPEPSTWTMMILGFGSAGAMLRSRRRALATA